MSSITELKDTVNVKTANFVLLSIATGGIYPILWMYRNSPKIALITKKAISDDTFIIWLAVCVGLSAALAGSGEEVLDVISGILVVASAVLYIVWGFKARSALQEHALNEHKFNLRMNGFYTFLLNVYYINYCINNLPEAKRKQDIISGNQAVSAQS